MQNSTTRTVMSEELLLVEISGIANRCARSVVDADGADDLAQDVVLGCLMTLRARTLDIEPALLPSLVSDLVSWLAMDYLRRR
jgi:hypothetical protein